MYLFFEPSEVPILLDILASATQGSNTVSHKAQMMYDRIQMVLEDRKNPQWKKYIKAARAQNNDDFEIDNDPPVSMNAEDSGAYVQGWIWVEKSEIEELEKQES